LIDDEKSAANKTRVLRVEYRREDQYFRIEILTYMCVCVCLREIGFYTSLYIAVCAR